MKLQIMAKLFDRMALVVKASVDTGQDGVKFAAYRVRLFGVRHARRGKPAVLLLDQQLARHPAWPPLL
jgi:hypothetical protein